MSKEVPTRIFTPTEREGWRQQIYDIYARMRAKADKPYEIEYGGIPLTVFPNVYAPEFFDDSLWYANALQEIVGNKSLLEVGTGTGVIAVFCAMNGAQVVATDINPDAVKNAQTNAERHKLDVSVREGDVYNALKAGEKFDFIFWAHPFNNWDVPADDMLLRSGLDQGYESLRAYVAGAHDHLTSEGKLLLGTGDSADLPTIAEIAKDNGYALKLVREMDRPLEPGKEAQIKDLIYEFAPIL
ncbi:class I SAM-dependent methyltransferase [Patescibacteria group bacterium]|nr:class I SAM-dependent methyltransferase [Patescibacteria group bacterium]